MAKAADQTQDMAAMNAGADLEDKEQKKRSIDEAATAALFTKLNGDLEKKQETARNKAAEIAKVPVKDEEVEILAKELAISKDLAKTKLQEKKGNLKNALTANLYLGQ